MQLTETQRRQLDEEGFILVPRLLSSEFLTDLTAKCEALWKAEGENAGKENYNEKNTRRLANLADKGEEFRQLYRHDLITAAVRHVVGDSIRLSMLNARDTLPRSGSRQALHCDTDNSGKPDDVGYYACTAIVPLDPFFPENGATRIVPRTHLSGKVPKEVQVDIFAPHPDEQIVHADPGDVFIFNGHCWHAGGPNDSDQTRRAILLHFLRADIPRDRCDRRQHISPEQEVMMDVLDREILGLDDTYRDVA